MDTVSFTKMEDGTEEDYTFLAKHEHNFVQDLPNRIMSALEKLRDSFSGYKIDRLEHSLQTATRASPRSTMIASQLLYSRLMYEKNAHGSSNITVSFNINITRIKSAWTPKRGKNIKTARIITPL